MAKQALPPVGRNMELCRRQLGLSAAEVARLIGVEPITFYRWRSGKNAPTWENVLVASRVFAKAPAWFYEDHSTPPPTHVGHPPAGEALPIVKVTSEGQQVAV